MCENKKIICKTNEEFWNEVSKVWNYEKNEKHWSKYTKGSNKKVWVKCDKTDYHGSYKTVICSYSIGVRCPFCANIKIHPKDSFAQWGIDNLGEDFLENYWDYDKNTLNPWETGRQSNKKIWLKCQEKEYHYSYDLIVSNFFYGDRCSYCSNHKIHPVDSFAQYHIDNTDENFLEKYWDYEKNILNPWEISIGSEKRIYIKCQEKEYHDSYDIRVADFKNGKRCSYCYGKKTHTLDSFGQNLINLYGDDALNKYWSDRNKYDPFTVKPYCNKYAYIKCQDEKCYNEYRTKISNFSNNKRCPKCAIENSKGDKSVHWNLNKTQEERESGRAYPEYATFIQDSLRLADYTCDITGQRGGKLVVHHLNGYHWFIEGRTDVNNAVVLSGEVHEEFHRAYGKKNNTKEQYEEFKLNKQKELNTTT